MARKTHCSLAQTESPEHKLTPCPQPPAAKKTTPSQPPTTSTSQQTPPTHRKFTSYNTRTDYANALTPLVMAPDQRLYE